MGSQTEDLYHQLVRYASEVMHDVGNQRYHSALYDARRLVQLLEGYSEAYYLEAQREKGNTLS